MPRRAERQFRGVGKLRRSGVGSVRDVGGGFTLIELLVALSILALLMALLIPAMARAREAARLVGCVSNLHQIMIATHAYSDESAGALPFPLPLSLQFLDNYGFGGRFTTSKKVILSTVRLPQNRPLNRFMFPDTYGNGVTQSRRELSNPRAYNLPLFECPSDDTFNYTERSREADPAPAYTQSAYFTTGTSYAFNITWLGNDRFFQYAEMATPYAWEQGLRMFKRSRYAYPSRFVAYLDEPGNFQSVIRKDPQVAHHTDANSFSTAFMDGHAGLVKIKRNRPFNVKHTLLFLEQQLR